MGGRSAGGAPAAPFVSPDRDRAAVRGRACAGRGRAGAARSAPEARAWERVIAALFVLAAVFVMVPAVVRAGRRARRNAGGDAPARVLAFAVMGLPETHDQWGQAMSAELETLCGRGARWRFALGCARAAGVIRARVTLTSRDRGGGGLRTVIGVGVSAAVALGAYGLVRYPGLRSGDASIAAAGFVALLVAYAAATLALSGGKGLREIAARRHGLVGGVAIGAAWLVVLSPTETLKEWVLVPLIDRAPWPRMCRRTGGARRASTSSREPAPRCGAGWWAAFWSSPSG